MTMSKTYHEMLRFNTFEERYDYLRLFGSIGEDTFGFDRYLNQAFYKSKEWRHIRSEVIVRDNGCDLAIQDRPIGGTIFIHHIEPITIDMFENDDSIVCDLDNLVCVSRETHQAIHFGDSSLLISDYVPRKHGDTKLW